MPITAYVDGSGMHDGSDILTLAAYVVDSGLIEPFSLEWNKALAANGLTALHMRTLDQSASGTQRTICDLLNVLSGFSQEFQYLRTCSVIMTDYREAKLRAASLKPAELLCVDFCLGGLSIPGADQGKDDVIIVQFDRGEPFRRYMYGVWQDGRKGQVRGWPQQVKDIQTADSGMTPGLQAADLFAWALNRQDRRLDQPQLAWASSMTMRRNAYCRFDGNPDFGQSRCTWSSSGRLVCDR
jgi:hypothetical protein